MTMEMNDALRHTLLAKLIALGDDELILAHRDAEWTGHAPILEEDIALANIAQDELGHASLYYNLAGDLDGSDPDTLAFFRDAPEFRCTQIVELPKGDWAFTMLRQFFFDAYEFAFLTAAESSRYTPLAQAAAKIPREEVYHLRHAQTWVERLALGTAESARRMQVALEALWPYVDQLFQPLPEEEALVRAGIVPALSGVKRDWEGIVLPHLQQSGLRLPQTLGAPARSRHEHTPHLADLLAEMQMVARADPQAEW